MYLIVSFFHVKINLLNMAKEHFAHRYEYAFKLQLLNYFTLI